MNEAEGKRYQARLLGTFEVTGPREMDASAAWRSRQGRTLLKALLLHRRHVVTTDQLLDLLWPEEDPQITRPRLYVRISQLRRMLDPERPQAHIVSVDGGYLLESHPTWWVDVDAFEDAAERGRRAHEAGTLSEALVAYEEARRIYRGDLLEEDRYAEWVFAERERLLERYLTLLTEMAEATAQQGRYRRAISLYRSILDRDPFREAVFVRLMLVYAHAGEPVQALRTFERCRRVLAEEMRVVPLASTQALAQRIRAGTLASGDDAPHYPQPAYEGRLFDIPYSLAQMPFVGREREYAWLISRWQDTRPGLVLVEGDVGVGKTRLVEEAAGFAAARGAYVLRTPPLPEGASAPYAPLIQALLPLWDSDAAAGLPDAHRRLLASLFSPQIPRVHRSLQGLAGGDMSKVVPSTSGPMSDARGQPVIEQAVARWVAACCSPDTLLVVDDAPRLDAASLALVLTLATILTVMVTARDDELPLAHPLRVGFHDLARARQGDHLYLNRLSDGALAALVRQLARRDPASLNEHLLPRIAGNPLFLTAALQALFEEGVLYVDTDGGWATTGNEFGVPSTVDKLIEQRLRHLTAEQRAVFDAIAVIGQDFNFSELQSILELEEVSLLDTLDELLASGLLLEPRAHGRAEFAPTHALYVEVARASLPRVRSRRLHGRVADVLRRLYPDDATLCARLADHLHAAGRVEEAVSEAILAGEVALGRYAVRQAIEHIESAAQWAEAADLDLAPSLLAALHAGWAEALRRCGQPEAAFSHYAESLTHAEGPLKLHLVYQMAALQATSGAELGSFDRWAPVLESEFSDDWLLGLLRCSQAFWAALRGDPVVARRCAAEGWWRLRDTRHGGIAPTWLVDRAIIILARTHALWGEWHHVQRYAAQALARNRAHDDVYGVADAHVTMSQAYLGLGRCAEAREHAERALNQGSEAGDLRLQGKALHLLALAQLGGEVPSVDVEPLVRRLLSIAEETGDLEAYARGTLLHAQMLQRAGAYDKVVAILDPLLRQAREVGVPSYVVMTLYRMAETRLDLGDLVGAREAVDEAAELATRCRMSHEVKRLAVLASGIGQGAARLRDAGVLPRD